MQHTPRAHAVNSCGWILGPGRHVRLQRAISLAVGKFHNEWNSTMICILLPTRLRIFSNGSTAFFICSALMDRPRFSWAAGSKGQIFIA